MHDVIFTVDICGKIAKQRSKQNMHLMIRMKQHFLWRILNN